MSAILGGGIGGLSAGYYLLKNTFNTNGMRLFLLEGSSACGGWIKSIRTDDYVFEQGPRTIRPKGFMGLNTLNMIQELGLSEHIVPIKSNHPAARNRMICVKNNLHLLPNNIMSVFRKVKPFSKPLIYSLFNDLKQPHTAMVDDSIYNFVARRFGKEVADYAISPMICGICAGDAKEISVKFLMKSLFEYEQQHGSVVKGLFRDMIKPKEPNLQALSSLARTAVEDKWNVYTIKGGLETLPVVLEDYLRENDVKIYLNEKVSQIKFIDSTSVEMKTSSGRVITANHVYSSLPAFVMADLLEEDHPVLAKYLEDIPFVTVAIVNLFFKTNDRLIEPAFGFLVPPIENSPILGVVFDSCCIPDQKGTVLTVMLGGRWFKERFGSNPTEEELLETAMKQVKSILKINIKPSASNVNILKDCIPQYLVGHYERLDKIRSYIRIHNLPLSLIGSSYDGVGINDVIYSAKTQVGEDSVF